MRRDIHIAVAGILCCRLPAAGAMRHPHPALSASIREPLPLFRSLRVLSPARDNKRTTGTRRGRNICGDRAPGRFLRIGGILARGSRKDRRPAWRAGIPATPVNSPASQPTNSPAQNLTEDY
ncbi:hypothetical protein, partial [Tatumella sp. JGM118]|uniref:hypothetical protein n=1 Tax=Tatumella sp. JGM118 TaxID=2799796 RepID=UPI001BAFE345